MINEWFNRRGDFKPAIQTIEGKGKGLVSTAIVQPQEQLAFISKSIFINKSNVLKVAAESALLRGLLPDDSCTERRAIMTFLLYIRFANDWHALSWREYANALPQTVDTPIAWPSTSTLVGTGLDVAVESKRTKLSNEFKVVENSLQSLGSISLDEFIWADFVIWSRSMSLESAGSNDDNLCIVPFLDFCNHSLLPNAHWSLKEDGIVLTSQGDIASGEEINISYGDKPNSELLFLHGFALPNNLLDVFTITPPFVDMDEIDDGPWLKSKLDTWKRLALGPMIFINPPGDEALTYSAWNPTNGTLSDENLLGMYICVLTNETAFPIESLTTTSQLKAELQGHAQFDILTLRIWCVLLEAVEYHLETLSAKASIDTARNLNISQISASRTVKDGQSNILQSAGTLLRSLIDLYSQLPSVQAYLAEMQ
jgi:SET domain